MNREYTLKFSTSDDAAFALASSPAYERDGICFAACGSGLYRSRDGGHSWELLRTSSEPVTTAVALSPAFAEDHSVFATVKGGVLRSSDGGDTWFTARFPAPPPVFSSLALSPNFERDGLLLAGTIEDGVFSSADRGARWAAWNFGLFDLNVLCLALSPRWTDDETAFAGTETGLYRSTNGGRAWRHSGFPPEQAPALSMVCFEGGRPGSTSLLVGTENKGLLASFDNGESWGRLAADAITGAVNQLHAAPADTGALSLFALLDDRVMRSDDRGQRWFDQFRLDGIPTAMLPLPDALLLAVQGKGIIRLPRD